MSISQASCTTHTYTLSLHDALPIYPQMTWRIELHPTFPVMGKGPRIRDRHADQQPAAFPKLGCGLLQFSPGIGDVLQHVRSEEHTSELQSLRHLVCRLLLEKKKQSA